MRGSSTDVPLHLIALEAIHHDRQLKAIPKFKTEAEERRFLETHDSTAYVDWSKATRAALPNLKPSTKAISLRLPVGFLDQIKITANKQDVPYQSLIKVWLAEKIKGAA